MVPQKRLQLIQNNAIRAITWRRKYDHISSSNQDLGVVKIPDLCKVEIASLMYKVQKSNLFLTFITNLLNFPMFIDIPLEAINNYHIVFQGFVLCDFKKPLEIV